MFRTKLMVIFLFCFGLLTAQSTIEGTVTDTEGNPLAGANVIVDGTSVGAASDSDGAYQIDVPAGTVGGQNVSLTASYIRYKNLSINVDIPMSGTVIQNFSLSIDAIGLKAISVTALGFEANRDKQ